jgi:hypothetical protein
VNQSLPESTRKFIEGKGVDFPVIASPKSVGKYELYELYGVGVLDPASIVRIFL